MGGDWGRSAAVVLSEGVGCELALAIGGDVERSHANSAAKLFSSVGTPEGAAKSLRTRLNRGEGAGAPGGDVLACGAGRTTRCLGGDKVCVLPDVVVAAVGVAAADDDEFCRDGEALADL